MEENHNHKIDAEIHNEVAVNDFETEMHAENNFCHDTVNVLSQVDEKKWNILSDASFWNAPIPDNFKVEIVKRGSGSFQNKDGPFSTAVLQYRSGSFQNKDGPFSTFSTVLQGKVSVVVKASPKLHNHEISDDHLDCFEKWKTLAAGLKLCKIIDANCVAVINRDKKKMERYLAQKSTSATVKASVAVSNLSPETQNDLITALANYVKEILLNDIKVARYFGIMFDTTSDTSHTAQISEVIRYVKIHNGKVKVSEVFLGFFLLKGKKADDLCLDILKNLESDGLDKMMCRAQGYDNAAAMSGIHGGV
ncbi:uncharacterized protein LOC136090945 [Hydra vulgaris]|uniref:Uncharacterized protein LOC136090945 n=1 Tax=Hydra vulgaris TaxID=6087 RepID=A0ABM4DHN5_HYDVU